MSTPEHRTLDEFASAPADSADEPDRPRFEGAKYTGGHTPSESDAQTGERGVCTNCGHYPGADFARVLGDNDGRVHACPECCESWSDLRYEASGREHPAYQVPWEVFD